jgi:LacI family transcriptional regulator
VLERTRHSGIPLVIVVREPATGSYNFVGADNERGTYEACLHLLEQGHRRIAFLGRVGGGPVYDYRRAGFERAMRERNLPIAPEWFANIALTREGGRDGIRQVLAMNPPPTAAVCYNDVVAFGAMSELGEHGLVVGRDFAVTGFDGVAASAHTNPPLTTVDEGPASLGESAAQTLLERLASPEAPPTRRLIEPTLIVRQSSGPPK